MEHKLITIHDQNAWETIITAIPHTFAHSHWYNYAMHVASGREIFLYHGKAKNFDIICPISPRKKNNNAPEDITTPYGFSGFASTGSFALFPEEWNAFLASCGFISGHIMLHPFFQNNQHYLNQDLHAGKRAYYLNLQPDLETIYRGFSSDHKHRLRQWQKMGLTVIHSKDEKYIQAFIQYYKLSLKQRNASSIYDFGEKAWRLLINSPQAQLLSIEQQGVVEASAIFILHEDIADYFMLASTDQGRLHARGIIWEAIQLYKQQGAHWLHLGCGIKENDALEQFKARWGATAFVTCALKQIYNQKAYSLLCQQYEVDPHDQSGYFPAYWQQTHLEGKTDDITT